MIQRAGHGVATETAVDFNDPELWNGARSELSIELRPIAGGSAR